MLDSRCARIALFPNMTQTARAVKVEIEHEWIADRVDNDPLDGLGILHGLNLRWIYDGVLEKHVGILTTRH